MGEFDPGEIYTGEIVRADNSKHFYFVRVPNHYSIFGNKDVFLHGSKVKNGRGFGLQTQAVVRFQACKLEGGKGPEAIWAEIIDSEENVVGQSSRHDETKGKKRKEKGNRNGKRKNEPDANIGGERKSSNRGRHNVTGGDYEKGVILNWREDKTGSMIYFVRRTGEQGGADQCRDDIFLHSSKLPSADKFFGLEKGTLLDFKLQQSSGRRPEIGKVKLTYRRYNFSNLLDKMEATLRVSKKESDLTAMLTAVFAWEEIGNSVKTGAELVRFLKVQNQVISTCRASENLVTEAMDASLRRGRLLDHRTGPVKSLMEDIHDREYTGSFEAIVWETQRSLILDYFVNVSNFLPKYISQIIRLIKNWTTDIEEDQMVAYTFKMLRNIGRAYLVLKGETDTDLMDYQEVPLIPTSTELLSQNNMEFQNNLLPVKPSSPYSSEEEYMETYFKIQRAEGYSPLCLGIRKYNLGELDHRDMNVYKNVGLVGLAFQNSRISLALRLESVKAVKDLSKSRYLMTGNLLCLTVTGDFSDPVWAKVSLRNVDLLKKDSVILVELIPEHNQKTTFAIIMSLLANNRKVLMAEAPTYYMSFGPVLKALQKYDISDLPIKNSIVSCETDSVPPSYLEDNRVLLRPLLDSSAPMLSKNNNVLQVGRQMGKITVTEKGETVSVNLLIRALEFDSKLDKSQEEAITHALTNRVAIIQGPPGAGKTFLGTKIVEILLNLEKPSPVPILVITYKNHALDEFLKGLVDDKICILEDICRVGGRSKEPMLEPCGLSKILHSRSKSRTTSDLQKSIYELNDRIRELEETLRSSIHEFSEDLGLKVEDVVDALEEEQIIAFLTSNSRDNKTLEKIRMAFFETQSSIRDIVKGNLNKNGNCKGLSSTFKARFKEWLPTQARLREFKTNIESIRESLINQRIKVYRERSQEQGGEGGEAAGEDDADAEDDLDAEEWNSERLELMKVSGRGVTKDEVPVITQFLRNQNFIVNINDFPQDCPLEEYLIKESLLNMEEQEKIKFLYALLHQVQAVSREKVGLEFQELEELSDKKEELEAMFRAEEISKIKIVGMTITGASINNALVKILKPEIVLVEEAAEILEPQLLVALTPNLKHLIMIGDHNQLPPQVNTFYLKRKLNFDVSMMQRLVQNRLPFVQLNMQNRMRPEIAELLKDIYPCLQSNISRVGRITLPRILAHSTYFWTHAHLECSERSKSNVEEAEMAVSLADILVTFARLKPTEITILSTYLGQVGVIKRKIEELTSTSKLLTKENTFVVSTVDNYQGDENQIVIVSLVRGNKNGSVGFLKEMPRRCVAQSRAQSCVIFIGNEATVRQADCWRTLMEKVAVKSDALEIHCPTHPASSKYSIRDATDAGHLLQNPSALCSIPCRQLFPCDRAEHACSVKCQPEHPHDKCRVKTSFTFPRCGHEGVKECWKEADKELCIKIIHFNFAACRHPETRACHKGVDAERTMRCKTACLKQMSCGKHACNKICGEDHSHALCKAMVQVRLASCGHALSKFCHEDETQKKCEQMVRKEFPACRHSKEILCHQEMKDFTCQEKVRTKLTCGHIAVHKCCEDKRTVSCQAACDKVLLCTHQCLRLCGESCADCLTCIKLQEQRIEAARKEAQNRIKDLDQQIKRSVNKDAAHAKEVTDQSEFDSVKNLVLNFIKAEHNWFPIITRMERVVNPKLEKEWWVAKSQLFDPSRDDERKFHGTGEEGVQNICFGNGFRLPDISRNNMFGQGVYFASNSSKSARELYTKGSNKLLLCKVLLGRSYTTKTAMNHLTPAVMKEMKYDSLYAPPAPTTVKNDEFVVYNPRQALPVYIIHYLTSQISRPLMMPQATVFKKTNVVCKRTMDDKDPFDYHYMVAESRFFRLQTTKRYDITSIDVVENPALEARFTAKQAEFKNQGIPSDYVFAFHGTAPENIDTILRNNFHLGKVLHCAYGFGMYFSEQPELSIESYSRNCKSVILCKLLLGNAGTNCKEVNPDVHKRCWAIVIGETNGVRDDSSMDQILPAYVIHFN